MPAEYQLDDKKNVNRPERKTAVPAKTADPLTLDQINNRLDSGTVTQMQQTLGNTAVQRVLAQRSGAGEVDEETAASIQQQRGSGGSLDSGMAQKAGQTMGQDFADVTIHTDAQADHLSRQLGAEAFTTGSDVFFREGAYDPASSDGQRLIAHELTHVVQQGAAAPTVQGKLSVNDPDDQFETQADSVADLVMNQPAEEEEELQLQEVEEEEELEL
ncbi:MAG: DUF4157 domain-containing protein [Chloroflexi bacterium]|nr:DUF4157 domain-containing protein [Chloroflexota bacterium]